MKNISFTYEVLTVDTNVNTFIVRYTNTETGENVEHSLPTPAVGTDLDLFIKNNAPIQKWSANEPVPYVPMQVAAGNTGANTVVIYTAEELQAKASLDFETRIKAIVQRVIAEGNASTV